MDKVSNTGDWQTRCNTVHRRLSHLLETKQWADCCFLVGEEETEEVTAHKFVLTMSSPVFEVMFHGVMAEEGNTPIAVPDIQPEIFKILLEFLYKDMAKIPTLNAASELYYAAKKYMIPPIQKYASNHILCQLAPQNACFVYEFASLFDEHDLLEASLKTIRRRTKMVLKASSFEDAQTSTVEMIFSQDRLEIDSELDLFEAAERYAQAHGLKRLANDTESLIERAKRPRVDENLIDDETKQTNLEQIIDDDDQQNQEKIKNELRKALSHVRFLTLSPMQFAKGAARSLLLTDTEALAIMLNLVSVDVPLPAGFSRSKEQRNVSEEALAMAKVISELQSPVWEAMCTFSVCNFKTRKRMVCSEPFYTDDAQWLLRVVPGIERRGHVEEKTLGVYLESNSSSAWQATVTLEIHSTVRSIIRTFHHLFSSSAPVSGYSNLVPWRDACEARAGLVRSNTLRVSARVVAVPAQNK